MKNRKEISLKVLIAFEVIVGIVVLLGAFTFESNNEIKNAKTEIQETIQYIKDLCNSSEIIDMASEAKSLMQATESVKQARNSFESVDKDGKVLKALAEDNYLDGLILLDEKGNIKSEYTRSGPDGEKLLSMIDRDELIDMTTFPEKIYNIRLQSEKGGHIDLAAACTGNLKNIIVGYFITSSAYENVVNSPIKNIVNGFNREDNGCVVVANDTDVLYSNDKSLIGKKIESIEILKKISEKGSGTELAFTKAKGNPFNDKYGLMNKSRKYNIYVFMDKKERMPAIIRHTFLIVLLYTIIITVIDIILWKNHLFYEKEKRETKQKYLKMLEEKNHQLEKALNRAQEANRAKTTFLSNMSHDIRTPINGIVGLLKINQNHFDDIDLIKENHRKMQTAADHLLSLINDVLEMSKIEDGTITLGHEFIDFAKLSYEINSIIEGPASENGISLEFKPEKERKYPCVYGSPVHLREIFLNIYGNCIKYNNPGGTITTKVDLKEEMDDSCIYEWTISDTGIGMSKEFLEHIFEPFVQEKSDARTVYQGVGLGMSITKSLLEKMNGSIRVSSEENVGTTFVITIPFETAKDKSEVKTDNEGSIKGLHLMLAEDNKLNAEIAATILMDEGAKVTVVSNGRQAVDLFNEKPAGTFDAVLMDVMMPVMDGLTATKQIRETNRADAKKIPIIAMTANAFEEDKKKCLDAGMDAHSAKPLDIENIKMILGELIGKA